MKTILLLLLLPLCLCAQSITLQWDQSPETNVIGYKLLRRNYNDGQAYGQVKTNVGIANTTASMPIWLAGATNFFSVTAFTADSESDASEIVEVVDRSVNPRPRPAAPKGLRVVVQGAELNSTNWSDLVSIDLPVSTNLVSFRTLVNTK